MYIVLSLISLAAATCWGVWYLTKDYMPGTAPTETFTPTEAVNLDDPPGGGRDFPYKTVSGDAFNELIAQGHKVNAVFTAKPIDELEAAALLKESSKNFSVGRKKPMSDGAFYALHSGPRNTLTDKQLDELLKVAESIKPSEAFMRGRGLGKGSTPGTISHPPKDFVAVIDDRVTRTGLDGSVEKVPTVEKLWEANYELIHEDEAQHDGI